MDNTIKHLLAIHSITVKVMRRPAQITSSNQLHALFVYIAVYKLIKVIKSIINLHNFEIDNSVQQAIRNINS